MSDHNLQNEVFASLKIWTVSMVIVCVTGGLVYFGVANDMRELVVKTFAGFSAGITGMCLNKYVRRLWRRN